MITERYQDVRKYYILEFARLSALYAGSLTICMLQNRCQFKIIIKQPIGSINNFRQNQVNGMLLLLFYISMTLARKINVQNACLSDIADLSIIKGV